MIVSQTTNKHQRLSHLGRKSDLSAALSHARHPVVPAEEDSRATQFATQTPLEVLSLIEASDLPRGFPLERSERATGEAKSSLKHLSQHI